MNCPAENLGKKKQILSIPIFVQIESKIYIPMVCKFTGNPFRLILESQNKTYHSMQDNTGKFGRNLAIIRKVILD